MLKTSDSTPPMPLNQFALTRVRSDNPVSVSTLAEIRLLVEGYTHACNFHRHIDECMTAQLYATELGKLLSLIYKIPSRYDLLDRSWHWHPSIPEAWRYRSIYTQKSASACKRIQPRCSNKRCTRPVIFPNVAELIAYMKKYMRLFRKHLPKEQQREEHDVLYALALSAFESWMDLARPHIVPSLRALRAKEEKGSA